MYYEAMACTDAAPTEPHRNSSLSNSLQLQVATHAGGNTWGIGQSTESSEGLGTTVMCTPSGASVGAHVGEGKV